MVLQTRMASTVCHIVSFYKKENVGLSHRIGQVAHHFLPGPGTGQSFPPFVLKANPQELLVGQVPIRSIDQLKIQVSKADFFCDQLDLPDINVVLQDVIVFHFILGYGRSGVIESRLTESGNSTRFEDPEKLLKNVSLVGHVVENVETNNSVNRLGLDIDAMPIKQAKQRRLYQVP